MDPIDAFEAALMSDPDRYGALRERLAINDDELLEELVKLRDKHKLSQSQVAERMNRSKTAVSNFERLGADPHLSTIRRYAAAVGALIETRVIDYDEIRESLLPLHTTLYAFANDTDAPAAPVARWSEAKVYVS